MESRRAQSSLRRLAVALGVAALLSCGGGAGTTSSSSSQAFPGTYAGTLATTGLCGSGNLTATIYQGGQNLFGSWTTTGFGTTSPCALDWSGGKASGAFVGNVVYLTLEAGSGAFSLAGTYAGDTISGTFTQTFSTGTGVSAGGTFSIVKQP